MTTEINTATIDISRRHPVNSYLRFVVKARAGKESMWEILRYIKVETKGDKRFIYAADGYRLHIADITGMIGKYETELPDGIYNVVTNSKSRIELQLVPEPGNFPNIWQLVPEPAYPILIPNIGYSNYPEQSATMGFIKVVRAIKHGAFNFKYFEDIEPENYNWEFSFKDKTSPFVFKTKGFANDGLTAVIMPIHSDD